MKKMLAVVLSLVTVFVLGTAVVFAAKHHLLIMKEIL